MTDLEARAILIQIYNTYGISLSSNYKDGVIKETFERAEQAILKLDKIKTITERALRSSDPINLYKALCIKEIAEILGVRVTDLVEETDKKGQITFDDII